jgi:hypothetical protein
MTSRYLMRILALTSLATLVACEHVSPDIECLDDETCDRFSGGMCLVYEPTGNQWCSYTDDSCESKRRWSDLDVGDGLEGTCMEAMPDGGVLDGGADADFDAPFDVRFVIDPDTIELTEYHTVEATVALTDAPPSDVTATLTIVGGVATLVPTTLEFSGANWNVPQVVAIVSVTDDDEVDESGELHVTAPGVARGIAAIEVDDITQRWGWPSPGVTTTLNNATLTAYQLEITTDTIVEQLAIWMAEAGGRYMLGLYSDADGQPGELLQQTWSYDAAKGHNMVDVTDTPLVPGSYWLAFVLEDVPMVGRNQADLTSRCTKPWGFGSAFPDSFGGCSLSQQNPHNIYAIAREPF